MLLLETCQAQAGILDLIVITNICLMFSHGHRLMFVFYTGMTSLYIISCLSLSTCKPCCSENAPKNARNMFILRFTAVELSMELFEVLEPRSCHYV